MIEREMEEKKGVLTEIIFHNEENGYTIAEMETDDELITVVGNLSKATKGTCYELRGTFKIHPRYGEQFAFTEAEEVLPSSKVGIEGFLASGVIKGIGPKTATAIVNIFGEDTLKIMEEDPGKLTRVPGIGKKKVGDIAKSFAGHREFAKVSLYFQGFGIPSASALRLYKAYGKDSMELIRENPYRLVEEVYGIGFKKADEIAGKMGINGDSPFRIKSGIKYCLMFFISDGNTYMPQDELCERVAQLLDLTRDQVYECLVEMAFTGDVKVEDLDDIKVVYLYSYYAAEQKVCANIADIARGELKVLSVDIDKTIALTEKASGVELSDQQKAAVKKSLTSGLSVITGGPGTGKTTIINTIINIFEESDLKVAIAAPTGRAAKRITETSGHYASTIHRLLEYYYSEGTADMQFGKTAEDPLDFDAVIVDEASMIDLMLMQGLTEAIKPGTRLVMVGDSDQLPSVGAGNVLLDIIQCGFIQTSKLTEIFRQAEESMIVVNAHRINHGEYPEINGRNTDFFFMERNNERDILDLMIQLVTKRLPDYYDGIDKLSDIQVLTPTRKGMIGTASLNEALQQAFNPPKAGVQEKKYRDHILRAGDKVMQIRNNYQLAYKIPGSNEDGQGIFNGDVGFIKAVDNEYGKVTVVYDDEKYVEYDFTQLDELELAYAVTVHKSQGSEFPIVVMPVSWFPPMLATRNLLYTAVTRGKRVVVLVGMENRLDAMVDNDRIKMRYSGLRPRLEKLLSLES
ncbi:exodeoxyribonuclease V alpha subunit [Aminicella lysinilytica]|uniref:ATP-dependent RecD2 DNA helicase n=3 Tax=Aminicella lysinilytica TaxID=433323 RepID=A0A4R6Q765_9FIRM|nr:exodeoxyribonuclease V alpha subunit [Aminicella lysinilytica]